MNSNKGRTELITHSAPPFWFFKKCSHRMLPLHIFRPTENASLFETGHSGSRTSPAPLPRGKVPAGTENVRVSSSSPRQSGFLSHRRQTLRRRTSVVRVGINDRGGETSLLALPLGRKRDCKSGVFAMHGWANKGPLPGRDAQGLLEATMASPACGHPKRCHLPSSSRVPGLRAGTTICGVRLYSQASKRAAAA